VLAQTGGQSRSDGMVMITPKSQSMIASVSLLSYERKAQ